MELLFEAYGSGLAAALRHETTPKYRTALENEERLTGWLGLLTSCFLKTGSERQALEFFSEYFRE